jgi:transketolase|tara:strand:- start:955 stop:1752 length:798 start_codon:yes stop_codon:yes gene_type:complete
MDQRSKDLRRTVVDIISVERRGHFGPAMSSIEILRVLFDNFLKFRASEPEWENRDRFILSKGHGCLSLYSILADKGFFSKEELLTFCSPNSRFGGHPDKGKIPGVEASTGALGHGLPIGVGMALAAKIKKQNHRVVVLTGDGEINEGSVWEAALSASKHNLSNLTVIVDYNKFQSFGPTSEVLDLEPITDKWRSFGFAVEEIDGHNVKLLDKLITKLPLDSKKPSAIICHTIKGKGFDFAEAEIDWHHKSKISDEDIKKMYKLLA